MNEKNEPKEIVFSELTWIGKLFYILAHVIYYGWYAMCFIAPILAFVWLTKGMALGGVVLVIEGIVGFHRPLQL